MSYALIPVLIVLIACATGVVCFVIDKYAELRKRSNSEQLRLMQGQIELRDRRIAELEQMQSHLQRQLDWHLKLMEPSGNGKLESRPLTPGSPTNNHSPELTE